MSFIHDDFLLKTKTAQRLYHEYAARMPVFDYHSHLPIKEVADNKTFANLTQAWLKGDHYKWRAMRTNGIAERYITGDARDEEKFNAWARTVPYTMRNPLYHWTHLELARYFGVRDRLLNEQTASAVYERCNALLQDNNFTARNLLIRMNVKVLCTTDDPLDDLTSHKRLGSEQFSVRILPTFRPDKAMTAENIPALNQWIAGLERITDTDINSFKTYVSAIQKRHDFFHAMGCRISDHGLETVYAEVYTEQEPEAIFQKIRSGRELAAEEILKFKSAMLIELALMDHRKGWTQQLHIGALRNNNSRMFKKLGPDTGYDSIADGEMARPLARFLDRLDASGSLPKTILYNLNPRDNEVLATMIGNYQDETIPGKMQFGSAWWFLDQKDGIEKQLNALSSLGLISRFVGMLTDSRSFLSFPRHEYFRRILCDLLGNDIETGELPNEIEFIGNMVKDICYRNAVAYFGIDIPE